MKRRPGNNPKRRVAPADLLSEANRVRLAQSVKYQGSGHHKRNPADYGLDPKFIWCVDDDGEVYEAKTDAVTPGTYHGYRLEEDDDMRRHVESVWNQRCRPAGK